MSASALWKQTEKIVAAPSDYLLLANDGDKAVVVFLGRPFDREICYVRGRYLPADESLIEAGFKPSRRTVHNVALLETREVRLFDQGVTFERDLFRVGDRHPLERWAFQLQRHGMAKDKRTRYSITPERELTPEEKEQLAALPLHDLKVLFGPPTVDPRSGKAIASRLSRLPQDTVEKFLREWGVQQVSELRQQDVSRVHEYIDELSFQRLQLHR